MHNVSDSDDRMLPAPGTPFEDLWWLADHKVARTTDHHLAAQRRLTIEPGTPASLVVVSSGSIELSGTAATRRHLRAGDVVLLHGPAEFKDDTPSRDISPVVSLPGGAGRNPGAMPGTDVRRASSSLVTADFSQAVPAMGWLLEGLPPIVTVVADSQSTAARRSVEILQAERTQPSYGSSSVTAATLGLLLTVLVRDVIGGRGDITLGPGWLRGVRDPNIAACLEAMHLDPGRNWSLEDLAAVNGISRATVLRSFRSEIGRPPLAYLKMVRLELAARFARQTTDPVGEIGNRFGYTSEASFNQAFSAYHGVAPGRFRIRYR